MALTPLQLKSLRYDLVELAEIKYDDVVDELLDHYASLTEQKMETGMSFDDASKGAWIQLGGVRGVHHIQASSVKAIERQIRTQHKTALKSYFRWPALLTTAMVAVLAYIIVPMIPIEWVINCVILISLIPYLFLLWGYYYGLNKQTDTGLIIWKYVLSKGGLGNTLLYIGLSLPNGFIKNALQAKRTFLETNPTVSVVICLLVLLYTTSFIQLFRHQYKHQLS